MKRTQLLGALVFGGLCCALAPVAGADEKGGGDARFVATASGAGLAEVNFGMLAVRHAASADVRKFAQTMVDDHTRANRELNTLASEKRFAVAAEMDREHQTLFQKLARLDGSAFDREYMEGQVKDHEAAVKLFEDESKGGSDEQLKAWAGKTLPNLRDHLKTAKEVCDKTKGSR
jgi:putative membrane protein